MNNSPVSLVEAGIAACLPADTSLAAAPVAPATLLAPSAPAGNPAVPTEGSPADGGQNKFQLKQVKTKVTKRIRVQDGVEKEIWDVRVGAALLNVYYTPHGARQLYTVSHRVDGKRHRQMFPALEKALEEAKELGRQLARGDFGTTELSAAERVSAGRAIAKLRPLGVSLELAAADYARAVTRLGKISLSEVVDFYLKRNPVAVAPKKAKVVVEEMLELKKSDGLSAGYLQHLRYDLKKFTDWYHGHIHQVTGPEIDKWLRGLGVSPRTRNNLRNSIQTLFEFAKSQKYLPKDHDEIACVPRLKDNAGEIEIFSPKEMEELLTHADERVIPFLALGAFAGVRHAEILRLEWKDLHFDAGIIEIRASKAKTASRRTVPMVSNLRGWLEPLRKEDGPVCVYLNMASEIDSLVRTINDARRAKWATANEVSQADLEAAEARATARRTEERKKKGPRRAWGTAVPAGAETAEEEKWVPFAWKHNALRHSFISYRVAEVQNVAQVALEAGNSPQMIFKHYRELVRPEAAKAWFGLMPVGKN